MDSLNPIEARRQLGRLLEEYRQRGDQSSWFNVVYEQAGGDERRVPWANLEPHRHFVEWAERVSLDGRGKRALQVGCGLGDDAEELARLGFAVTAFDISPIAIDWCRRRFPDSPVDYQVADLFNLPTAWRSSFDFVLEINTLQALPRQLLGQAIERVASCVAPDGSLLVICWGANEPPDPKSMPLPLLRSELAQFEQHGLHEAAFDEIVYDETPPARRFRVLYHSEPAHMTE